MIVYKTCYREFDGTLISYASDIRNTNWCVKYEMNKISYPIGKSMLFAYNTLEKAKQYLEKYYTNNNKFVICECETSNIHPLTLYYAPSCYYALYFWQAYNNKKKYSKFNSPYKLPRGTVLCKYLKPIKIVYDSKQQTNCSWNTN